MEICSMRLQRLVGLTAAAALTLGLAAPALAADTAKLTAVVGVDNGAPASGNVWVRVLHGSPDAPSVDVFVDNTKVDGLSGAEFGDLTDYVEVPAGSYDIKVCATADNSVCVIDLTDVALPADAKVTITASDMLAQIKHHVFVDGTTAPADGNVAVRVVHLSADTPAVDVLTQDGSAKVFENISYPNATDYAEIPAGSYDLKVCAAADNSVCPLDPGALDLAAGDIYTVFAIGSLAATLGTPETDTAPASSGAPMLLLAAVAAFAFAATLRFVPARARR
jgi:hypothetical protein